MSDTPEFTVLVEESGEGPYAQRITLGRHAFTADEPLSAGGRDTGPSPYQLLLAALGACTAMTVRMYARRHNWPLEKVSVALFHEKVAAGDGGKADKFSRAITLGGALDPAQRQRLLEIATRCPVSQTLQRPSQIETRLV